MKTTYIYFGQKGYYYEKDGTGDQEIGGDTATSLTLAGAGMLPVDHAHDSAATSTDAYRVIIKAATGTSGDRGTALTTDYVTGEAFAAAANPAAGDVTALGYADYDVANTSQVTVITASSAVGYDIQNNDKVWLEQVARHDACGNGPSGSNLSSAFAYPMSNFLGANPVAYAGEHYDNGSSTGTLLDQTDLYFLKSDGTGGTDIIRIIHTANKYPDLVKTMEAIQNCGVYHKAITFYDLDINGVETFAGGPTLSGANDLGIKGCWRTTA